MGNLRNAYPCRAKAFYTATFSLESGWKPVYQLLYVTSTSCRLSYNTLLTVVYLY